jgi:ATP-dependent RNA helicase DeaD
MGNAAKNHLSDKSFQDFYLSDSTLRALETMGYVEPTPVQSQSIPLVMAGIDLIVMSQTGTGKTAAFAIPTIEMLDPEPGRIDALILAPTRELAIQVAKEFGRLGQYKSLEIATIYGGTSYEKQYKALETANIISATPGRLLDLLKNGKCDLSELRVLILDEADEMLSMGFAEELDAILAFLPEERQSLLFSATITNEVKALSNKLLYYPEYISMSDDSVAAADVTHAYYSVRGVGRARDLLRVIEYEQPDTAIIFANTKADTFMVTKFLKRHGYRADVINGDLPQKERERTLASLRKGETDFLVATDVAARGIDISDLSHVFNYVLPDSAEVYVHRTGRTGRAGKKGRAVSLISPAEFATLFNMKKIYKIVPDKLSLPTTKQILSAKRRRHVAKLRVQLENTPGLPYGGKIGIAQHLLETGEDGDENVRFVARLLALADKVAKGADTDALAAALAAEVTKSVASQPTEEPEAEVEVEAAEETQSEAKDEPKDDDKKSSRRNGRSRRDNRRDNDTRQADSRDEPEDTTEDTKVEATDSGSDDGSSRRRRRRRRRGADDDNSSEPKTSSRRSGSRKSGSRRSESKGSGRRSSSRGSGRRSSTKGSGRRSDSKGSGRKKSSRRSTQSNSPKSTAPKPMQAEHAMSKLWVNMGRDQFDKPDDVVEMVCYMAGMDPEDIGSVSLESSFSYVEVREDYFYDIIKAMNQQDWNGETVAAEPARK